MKKQCIVRTDNTGKADSYTTLSEKLQNGWIVKFVNKITEGTLEYVLEKDYKSQ